MHRKMGPACPLGRWRGVWAALCVLLVFFSALARSTNLPHIPGGGGLLHSADISAGRTRTGFGSRQLRLSLRGGSASAVDVEGAVEEPKISEISNQERNADDLSSLSLDPNGKFAQAEAEAADADDNFNDMAAEYNAMSSDLDDHPVAPTWDEPTGASAPGLERVMPVFDPVAEMNAALGRENELASAGALRDSCSGVRVFALPHFSMALHSVLSAGVPCLDAGSSSQSVDHSCA